MPGRHIATKRPRSFASIASIVAVLAAVVPWSLAGPAQAAGIPANFFTVNDTGGPNDAVGQGDLTQMGRDDSDPTTYMLEWGWDNIVWPGNNTGDACALFDSNGDGNIDYAICVEIGAGAGATVVQKGGSPTTWTCNDAKNDRCAGPTQVLPTAATVGTLATFAASPPADLVTTTDPFPAGTDSNKDSTIQVRIPKNKLPANAILTNVCSYPSIGSGGNTDPKDCVANPGGGFLVIHKNAGNNNSTVFPFTIDPGAISVSSTGTGDAQDANGNTSQSVVIGSGYSFAESVPGGWLFDSATCSINNGVGVPPTSTGTAANFGVTGISVESGKVTTCTVVDELQNPHITLLKQADKASVPTVGGTINYTLTATNDGNVPLTNVHIDDTLIANANLTCNPVRGSTLNPTQTMTCTGSHTVTQADIDSGHVNNTGTATGTPSSGPNVTDTDSVQLAAAQTPALTIVKDVTPTSYNAVGDILNYTITATNTGNVTLTSGGITDPMFNSGNTITSPCTKNGNNVTPPTTLVPGDVLQCTASHTITLNDMNNGSVSNTATAHGTPPTGPALAPTDNATATAVGAPSFSITKSASPTTYDAAGQTITYTLTETNTGNVTLNGVIISDPMFGGNITTNCKKNAVNATPPVSLDPGDVLQCTATHQTTQAEVDAGSIHNTATGHATGLTDKTADATVTATQTKSIDITKTPKPTTYTAVGDVISYDIVATNDGNVTLTQATVSDPKVSNLLCVPAIPVASLAPGDKINCTASHTIDQGDMDAGHFSNTATATGTPPSGPNVTDTDTANVTTNQTPQIGITKVPSVLTYSAVGDVINYTIVATNTGNVTLTQVNVTDPKVSNLVCVPATPIASMAPGDHTDCTASYTITQADLDKGTFTNTAHTVGTPPSGPNVTADAPATVTAIQAPGLSVVKVANPTVFSGSGQNITYTVTATNTGNVTLSNFSITDPLLGGMMTSCTDGGVGVLNPPVSFAPAAVMVCTASYQTTVNDVQAGQVANTATGAGLDPTGAPVSATGSATVPFRAPPPVPVANLGITKSSVPASGSFVQPGDQVVYTLGYTNTGNGAASNVVVTDTLPADLDYVAGSASNGGTYDAATRTLTWNIGTVSAGGGGSVSFTGQVANTATNGEVLSNVGVITAPGVSLPSNPDDVTVTVPTGALTLTKQVDHKSAEFGDTLTYSVLVAASDTADETNVVVTDSVPDKTTYVDGSATCDAPCTASESGGVVTWTIGTLAKGTSTTVSFKVTIDTPAAASDGAIPAERIRNVAVGSSDDDPGVTSNKVITDITAVLGVTHHRKPHVKPVHHDRLPFTGLPYSLAQLLTMAGVAIGAGTLLVHRARTRRALAAAITPPTDE